MIDTIINVKTLPETLRRRIRSSRVQVSENNGAVILTPVDNANEQLMSVNRIFGMFSDGKISTDKYIAQKQLDKDME